MYSRRALLYLGVATLTCALLTSADAAAQLSGVGSGFVRIDNFGKVNDNYYRGAQPVDADFADLAALGIRTVIDLTRDGRSSERAAVERTGMKFYRIPMTTSTRPADTAVAEFLRLVNDPSNQPIYVHCQGGRHRTGVMTAIYRITENGWTADRAYEEMKRFHFEGFPDHPVLRNFVFDYDAQVEKSHHNVTTAPAAVAVASR